MCNNVGKAMCATIVGDDKKCVSTFFSPLQIAIVSTFLIAVVLAELPVNSYLPPQARNNNNNNNFGGSAPSRSYGAPAARQQPSRNYGAPAQQNKNFAPRTNYGPPAQQQPQPQLNTNYGAPQQQQPSTNYGVPTAQAQDFNNFDSQRANSYQQAPSNSYGVPTGEASSYNTPSASGYSTGPSAGGYSNGGYEEPAKYEFQYDVQDEQAGLDFGHKEQREGSVATGRYYVLLPDGRKQVKLDFFPSIAFNKSSNLFFSHIINRL